MKYHDVDFDTYFRNYPDANGYFGKYGGSYIPPQLQAAMDEITDAYMTICKSSKFVNEFLTWSACHPRWATSSCMPSGRISTTPVRTS